MNKLQTTLCLSLAVFSTSCSNDNGSDKDAEENTDVAEDSGATTIDDSGNPPKPDGNDSTEPSSVAFSCSESQSFTIPPNPQITATSATTKSESGSEGDILFDCKSNRFSLTPGINSLNLINLQKRTDFDFSCNNKLEAKGNLKFDYKAGTVTYTGTINGQSASCTSTFTSPLETEISDDVSISKLLVFWGTDEGNGDFLSTTCENNEDKITGEFNQFSCSGASRSNYTVMDSEAKTHKLSIKNTVSFQ